MNPTDLISRKTRNEFREFLVGFTLAEIADEFDAEGFKPDLSFTPTLNGQRRCCVEQFYHTIDFSDGGQVERLLRVFENILVIAQNRANSPSYDQALQKATYHSLVSWLRKDGYVLDHGRLVAESQSAALRHLKATAVTFGADYLASQLRRIEAAVISDPDLAIGQAKELVETCCRTILREHGITDDFDKLDVHPLAKKTMEALKLVPDAVPDSAKGAKSIKAVLVNLATVAQGLAELRNLYGTGHGKYGKARGLEPRHARLAVAAAEALATFLLDIHLAQSRKLAEATVE